MNRSITYKQIFAPAIGMALAGMVALIWLSLGVGIIGADGDPANRMYLGVVLVTAVGSGIARFRPVGMARTMIAAAIVQAVITAVALFGRLGLPYSGPAEILGLNALFIAWFVASARIFYRAAKGRMTP